MQAASMTEDAKNTAGRWVLAAAVLGSSMAFIDSTVVNVALPALQAAFHASGTQVQWVIESYALFLAALILVGGSLGDHFGRRRVFLIGTVFFGASSVACGMAASMGALIAARALQGVGAAMLIPGSLALISASFPEETRGKAIGTWSGFSAITAAVGPLLGGALVQYGSWRWVFFLNVPFAVAVVVLCLWHVPEVQAEQQAPLDWVGAALATLGLSALTFALLEFARFPLAWLLGVFGVVLLVLFVLWQAHLGESAMVPLRLFRSRNFSGANLLTLLLYAALAGLLYYQPLNLIQVQHYTPQQAGAAMLPIIVLMFLLSRWSGGLVEHVGERLPLVAGPLVVAAGFLLLAVPGVGGSYWMTYFPGQVVLGLGLSVTVAPLTTTVMNAVSKESAGVASGVNNAVSRVTSLLAIAVFGLFFQQSFSAALLHGLQSAAVSDTLRQSVYAQRTALAAIASPEPQVRQAVEWAFVAAFRRMAVAAAVLALLSSAAALWLVRRRTGAPSPSAQAGS